eukprot:c9686_g1_i1.p1 GENE.c9686_g1_i1~~c9686_g1_i1.p1  ORF type:complete len:1123 (+),score=248.80 c9686_g1_i1:498-3866(+)
MTDSVPPHVIELSTNFKNTPGQLGRVSPFPDLPLPLIPGHRSDGDTGILTDVAMLCHSNTHGDRMFLGSDSKVFRINTTFAAVERERVSELQDTYITGREMLTWVALNRGHRAPRGCWHDTILQRLYVVTRRGLLAYSTAQEPFGKDEASGAQCESPVDLPDGLLAVDLDKFKGQIFATAATTKFGVSVLRFQAVPNPFIEKKEGVIPPSAPVHSKRVLDIFGSNITNMFEQKVSVGFAKIRSEGNGQEIVTEDPISYPATFVSQGHVSVELPDSLLAGEYLVTVREHNSAYVSNGVRFVAYQNPTLLGVEPTVAQSKGGALITINGLGFIDTGVVAVEFWCNSQHHVANGTFVSSSQVTVRSPAIPGSCASMVKVSLNGLDFVEKFAGQVQFVDISLSSIDPDILTVRGDAEFGVRGTGFVDSNTVMIGFRPKGHSVRSDPGEGFSVSTYFDESYATAFGKTLPFHSAGLFVIDMYLEGVKVTDSRLIVEVVNVTVHDFSPKIATTNGGIDLQVTGTGFPKHKSFTVVFMSLNPTAGFSEIEVGAEVNDKGTSCTLRLPHLPAGQFKLSLRVSAAEDISFPADQHLTIHAPLPLAVAQSPACVHKGTKGHVIVGITSTSQLRQQVSLMPFATLSAKLIADTNPAMDSIKSVQPKSFFDHVDGVVNSNSVTFDEDGDNPRFNVSVKLAKAGYNYKVLLSINGEEWHLVTGSVFVYDYEPQTIRPSSGPSSGGTLAQIEGTGFIRQCGSMAPIVRFNRHIPGRQGASWFVDVNARVIDRSTLAIQTPRVEGSGVTTVEVSFDGLVWISLPVDLPTDNFWFYRPEYGVIEPALVADAGGSVVTLFGHEFPDTGSISIKLGADKSVRGEWKSESSISFTTPQMPTGSHDLSISFNNGADWKAIAGVSLFVFPHVQEGELGISPVAGSRLGGTTVSLTLLDGEELAFHKLTIKFVCNQSEAIQFLGDLKMEKSTVQLTDGNIKNMATVTFQTPLMPVACGADILIARNGKDFHTTGHHFKYYQIESSGLSVNPRSLKAGKQTFVFGSGFVDSRDEMAVKFANPTNAANKFVTGTLVFNGKTELEFQPPKLDSLWATPNEPRVVFVQITFNGQEWIDVGQLTYESSS